MSYNFYKFLIQHPIMGNTTIMPWIKYIMTPYKPTISATFGGNYPVLTQLFYLAPINYVVDTISPEQMCLFQKEKDFTPAVNFIL